MKRRLLLILAAVQRPGNAHYRLIKYSEFPPLSLMTIAGLTPDTWDITLRDEHVESSEVEGDFDLVGIQTYISSAARAYELAALWRGRGAKVVLGGLHATSLPHEAAAHADAVCIGPAESVWGQILDDCEHGRLAKFYRGQCEGSAALVPMPRRDLMNTRAYLVRHTMVTSRGCPHSCDFCYKSSFWGPKYYEPRPMAEVERELSRIDDGLVFFLDDNLLANRRHARALFEVLRGSGIVWQAAASLDIARDARYLAEAYNAGCRSLFLGFESLSPENMRGNNKPVNAATDYAEVCRRFHDAGIMINGSFVFGFDCDRPDVFERTVEFTIENKILTASFHVLTPLPGTRAYERLEAEGRLLHRNWSLYDTCNAVFRPRHMTPELLDTGYEYAKQQFATYRSILQRSLGLPGALKRIAYNVAWLKVDPLWVAIIRAGLMPFATRIFERILRIGTRAPGKELRAVPSLANATAEELLGLPPVLAASHARQLPVIDNHQQPAMALSGAMASDRPASGSSFALSQAESDRRRQRSNQQAARRKEYRESDHRSKPAE